MSEYAITAITTSLGSAYVGNETITATLTIEATTGITTIKNIIISNTDFKVKNKVFPFSINSGNNLADIVTLYPDSVTGGYRPVSYQDVQYDGNYFYIAISFAGAAGIDISFIIKISEDFSTTYSKLYYEKDAKMFFNTAAKDTIMVVSSHNPNFAAYNVFGYRHHYFVYDSENAGVHLDPIGPYYDEKHYSVAAVSGNQLFANGIIVDGSDNIVVYGISYGTRYNYIRFDAAGNYQFAGRLGYDIVVKAIYANSSMYAIGNGEEVQKINITTDTIDASYTYADSAQSSIVYRDVIYDSNGKIVVTGYQTDGSGNRTGLIYQVEADLTAKNYNVQIAETNNNIIYEGLCEYDGFIFATGHYVDGSGNSHGVISKFNLTDLSHVETIQMSNDKNYLLLANPEQCNDNLVIYGRSERASGDIEGLILKIYSSNLTNLVGFSDSTGTFSFNSLSVTSSNPTTTSWTANGLTMTASSISDFYTSVEDVIDRDTDKTIYNSTYFFENIGVEFRPTSKGIQTCNITFDSDAVTEQTAILTAEGVLLNEEKDYQIKASETWEFLSNKFYESPNFVNFLISANPHLTMKQKRGIFAPKGMQIYIPEITAETIQNGGNNKKWYEK